MLVHDENLPRDLWRIGRIKELFPGADGVRSVVVRIVSAEIQLSSTDLHCQSLYGTLMVYKERSF